MGEILSRAKRITKCLTVYPRRMEKNLDILKGLILSAAVMMELGQSIGRQRAHEVVYEASMKARDGDIPLKEALMQDSRVTEFLSEQQVEKLFDPKKYIGLSVQITRDMVALTRKEREKD